MATQQRGPETLPSCSVSVAGQVHLQRQRQLKAQRAATALGPPRLNITAEQRVELARRQVSSSSAAAAAASAAAAVPAGVGYKALCPPGVDADGFEELVVDEAVDEYRPVVVQPQQQKKQQQHKAAVVKKPWKNWLRMRLGTTATKRLVSGGFAGAISRTAVAPLETIRTHLMVGTGATTAAGVFNQIVKAEGWKGLFRGNGVNVIRVAPSKAIEVSE